MRKLLQFLVVLGLLGGALVGAARATAIRWWRIPTDDPYLEASIAPTLRGGDLVILWRLTPPKFGDLALCPEPGQTDRIVIGRIAGLPGDKIEVKGTSVQVNRRRAQSQGSCLASRFTVADPRNGNEVDLHCDREELGSRVHLRGNALPEDRPPDSKTLVEPETVFLLSDNRQFPYDSRDFGLVDRDTCTESIVFRLVGVGGFSDVESRLSIIH